MTNNEYRTFNQNTNFHFSVSFNGLSDGHIDARFQSVSGLEASFETETIKEGGENRFEHVIPVRRKYADLSLKRGLLTTNDSSVLTNWLDESFRNFFVRPINIDIILLNEEHKPLMKWKVIHAWAKSWKMGELNAEKGEILLETIELSYNRFEFKTP